MKHTVSVLGRSYTVTVDQKSQSIWVAVGGFMGERLEAQGRNEATALERWYEKARHVGNDPLPRKP
jgi:hypothetical protein